MDHTTQEGQGSAIELSPTVYSVHTLPIVVGRGIGEMEEDVSADCFLWGRVETTEEPLLTGLLGPGRTHFTFVGAAGLWAINPLACLPRR